VTARPATAIVLAGGRSARFGSQKLEAMLDGRPLLDHVLERAREVSAEIVVALPPNAIGTGPEGVIVVPDPEPFGGPLVGLASALDQTSNEIAVVVGGDMPRLRPAVLLAMLGALEPAVGAVVLGQAGGARPLPLAVRVEPARLAAHATLDAGDRSLRALLDRLDARVLDAGEWRALDPEGDSLVDIDRPADLERLRSSPKSP
jgi:molybdopterin-guanine dinucleotide biosynthesis protein A